MKPSWRSLIVSIIFICVNTFAASPGSQPSSSSSSSSADNLTKFYQSPNAAVATATGYMTSGSGSSCGAGDQRGLVGGFATHGYPAVYPGDCLSPYSAYSYGGGGGGAGGSCLDSYLKVRSSPYPVSTDYPSYFSRVAGLHHHHHAAAAAAARSAGHVVGYDYGSA